MLRTRICVSFKAGKPAPGAFGRIVVKQKAVIPASERLKRRSRNVQRARGSARLQLDGTDSVLFSPFTDSGPERLRFLTEGRHIRNVPRSLVTYAQPLTPST